MCGDESQILLFIDYFCFDIILSLSAKLLLKIKIRNGMDGKNNRKL
jgi:hypothetical protein